MSREGQVSHRQRNVRNDKTGRVVSQSSVQRAIGVVARDAVVGANKVLALSVRKNPGRKFLRNRLPNHPDLIVEFHIDTDDAVVALQIIEATQRLLDKVMRTRGHRISKIARGSTNGRIESWYNSDGAKKNVKSSTSAMTRLVTDVRKKISAGKRIGHNSRAAAAENYVREVSKAPVAMRFITAPGSELLALSWYDYDDRVPMYVIDTLDEARRNHLDLIGLSTKPPEKLGQDLNLSSCPQEGIVDEAV